MISRLSFVAAVQFVYRKVCNMLAPVQRAFSSLSNWMTANFPGLSLRGRTSVLNQRQEDSPSQADSTEAQSPKAAASTEAASTEAQSPKAAASPSPAAAIIKPLGVIQANFFADVDKQIAQEGLHSLLAQVRARQALIRGPVLDTARAKV